MPKGGKQPGAGRPKGTPNKATINAREAIADFVEGNVERLNGWLDAIAEGIPDVDDDGNPTGKWIQPPSPKDAYNCLMSVVEYHIPKLARTEHTGKDGGSIDINAKVQFLD